MSRKNKSLWQSYLFWAIIFVGILLVVWTGQSAYHANQIIEGFCFSLDCVKLFYDVFSLPIKIASAFAAITGIYGMIFQSIQTKELIVETARNNVFSNYITHRNLFREHIKAVAERKNIKISDLIVYRLIFRSSKETPDISISKDYYKNIEKVWKRNKGKCSDTWKDRIRNIGDFIEDIGCLDDPPITFKEEQHFDCLYDRLTFMKDVYKAAEEFGNEDTESQKLIKEQGNKLDDLISEIHKKIKECKHDKLGHT